MGCFPRPGNRKRSAQGPPPPLLPPPRWALLPAILLSRAPFPPPARWHLAPGSAEPPEGSARLSLGPPCVDSRSAAPGESEVAPRTIKMKTKRANGTGVGQRAVSARIYVSMGSTSYSVWFSLQLCQNAALTTPPHAISSPGIRVWQAWPGGPAR